MDIDTSTRVGRMLDALVHADNPKAKVMLTVDVAGQRTHHQEFRVKAWTGRDGTRMLTYDLNDGDWAAGTMSTRVLHVNCSTGVASPARGYTDQLVLYMARAALRYACTGTAPSPANGSVQVQEQLYCGCCGRRLTHPASLALGIGPECASRMGLAHHYGGSTVAATRAQAHAVVAALPTEGSPSYEALTSAAIVGLQRQEQRLQRLADAASAAGDFDAAQHHLDQLDECRGQRSGLQAELRGLVGSHR